MGKLSAKIKRICILIVSLVNSIIPILLLSNIAPVGVIVGGNILCSVAMVFFSKSNDIEAISTNTYAPSIEAPSINAPDSTDSSNGMGNANSIENLSI